MPKVHSPRISEVQRQRQQIAKKAEKYGPSSVYLQVLGSGARGAPNTLYLFTDQKRYLFNCGEQTQRLAHEHKVKLSRLEHIFITSKTWKNIGGLPGLSLTLQDVGVPSITLHGPSGLDELYNATRRFVIMKDMKVTMAPCTVANDFQDNVMTVKYVLLSRNEQIFKDINPTVKRQKTSVGAQKTYEEFMHDDTDYYKREKSEEKKYFKERTIKPQISKPKLSSEHSKKQKVLDNLINKTRSAVSYICTLKKRLGTLDLAKCVERGVKPGPMLGQLKNGQDVVLPDGTIVLSKDVKTPDDPGPVFIVLDVPDITYLKENDFAAHFADSNNSEENIPTLIVHYTPPHVFHTQEYQNFLKRFGRTVRHLILNGQNSCLGSEAVHRTQHKLHLLDPDIFPLLKDVSVPAVWNVQPPFLKTNSIIRLKGLEELKNKIALAQFQNIVNMEASCKDLSRSEGGKAEPLEVIAGRTMTTFQLRPKKQLDRSTEPKLHIQEYIQETMDVDGFVKSLESFRKLVDSMRYERRFKTHEYPKVVFLGTGSCIPSKTRNTSAIVIHVDENRSMLLDCGEGTFGQLVRFYGPKKVNSFLRSLRAIYVSHLHADHHIGLIGVLQARRQAYDEISAEVQSDPIYLMAPGQIMSWLTIYHQQFEPIRSEFMLIPNQSLLKTPSQLKHQEPPIENIGMVFSNIGVNKIQTCIVPHCPNAFGVAIDFSAHKITYSGDTLPCEALIDLGQKSTLLIHEATMEDELAEEARTKMHSTTTQAIDIGVQMNARYTILTHFSQRYARLPRLNANILNDNKSVGIAFDNMQVTLSDLELLPHMYAPLQLMFAEHCIEMELKAAHRARQKQRALQSSLSPDIDINWNYHSPCRVPSPPVLTYLPPYKDSISSKLRARAWSSLSVTEPPSRIVRSAKSKSNKSTNPSTPSISKTATNVQPQRPRYPNGITRLRPSTEKPPLDTYSRPSTGSSSGNTPGVPISQTFPAKSKVKTVNMFSKSENAHIKLNAPPCQPCASDAAASSPLTGYVKPLDTLKHKRHIVQTAQVRRSELTPMSLRSHMNTCSPNGVHSAMGIKSPKEGSQSPTRLPSSTGVPVNVCSPLGTMTTSKVSHNQISKSIPPEKAYGSYPVLAVYSTDRMPINNESFFKTAPRNVCGSSCSSVKSVTNPVGDRSLKGSTSLQNRVHTEATSQNSSSVDVTRSRSIYRDTKTRQNNLDDVIDTKATIKQSNTYVKSKEPAIKPRETTKSRAIYLRSREKVKSRTVVSARPGEPSSTRSKETLMLSLTARMNRLSRSSDVNQDRERRSLADFGSPTRPVSATKPKAKTPVVRALFDKLVKEPRNEYPGMPAGYLPKTSPFFSCGTHSNKSFKPQLEDIKSSFLLLNDENHQSRQKEEIQLNKPKPLDEEKRIKMLTEVKKVFTSKQYLESQKYEKIEGLNWISWK